MKWLDDIRKQLGRRRLLNEDRPTRRRKVHNFSDARSVGILYREKGEGFFILVKQYVKYLRTEHGIREIMALGYIDQKGHVPHYHVHKLKYDYFHRGEVNWRFEPNCRQATDFIHKDYDLLIDLEREPVLPLQFILARSKAHFKVGYYNPDLEDFYDLMIDLPPQATFDEYVNQVNHYLTLINKGNARA